MDSITHLTQKILVERARQGIQPTDQIPETAPPPYTASEDDASDDDEVSDSDDENDPDSDDSPVRLTINAANSIHGSNNLVPTSPSPLADATKFSALLLHAVNRINCSEATASTKRRINVDLTINCGITIVGDRNVVGNVGLKPRSPERAIVRSGTLKEMGVEETRTSLGAKRKAQDTPDDQPEPTRQKCRAASAEPGA